MTARIKPKQVFEIFLDDFKRTGCLDKENFYEMGDLLLDYFFNLGKRMGFKSWAKHCDVGPRKNTHEYMVDVCWEVKDKVALAAAIEIEVNDQKTDEIMHDFEKLTDIKALAKIGLCCPYKPEREKVLKEFGDKISKHEMKLTREEYLMILFGYRKTKNEWFLTISGYTFEKNGESTLIGKKEYPW
jgi:hypothetical protein